MRPLFLMTTKPVLYVANVAEDALPEVDLAAVLARAHGVRELQQPVGDLGDAAGEAERAHLIPDLRVWAHNEPMVIHAPLARGKKGRPATLSGGGCFSWVHRRRRWKALAL